MEKKQSDLDKIKSKIAKKRPLDRDEQKFITSGEYIELLRKYLSYGSYSVNFKDIIFIQDKEVFELWLKSEKTVFKRLDFYKIRYMVTYQKKYMLEYIDLILKKSLTEGALEILINLFKHHSEVLLKIANIRLSTRNQTTLISVFEKDRGSLSFGDANVISTYIKNYGFSTKELQYRAFAFIFRQV